MLVFEAIIAPVLVVCVAGGLFYALVLDRRGKPLDMNAVKVWWLLVGLGLIGIAIAWTTSSLA